MTRNSLLVQGKMYLSKLRKSKNRLFSVSITALIFVISLAFPFHGFASLSSSEAEEARLALERLGRVYVSANDILKLANEIDPSTKLPYADTLSFLILVSKAQRHLESQDYGKLFGESTWFVGKKAIGNAYPFAMPFLTLGEFYYGLFKKITGIPQHFENQFFKFQMNKYLSLREAYDAKSVREFALDSPLGLADDRAKGYFFSGGMAGSTSTQVNLALRLRNSGIPPETIFELGERLWDIQQKLSSLPNDGSVRDLVQRIKEGNQSATGPGLTSRARQNVVQTSEASDYLLVTKRGARWTYTVTQEVQTTTSGLGRQSKATKQESGTLTISNEGEKDFDGLNASLFVSHYQFKFGSYSRNSYYRTSPEGTMLVGSEFIQPTKPPRRTKHDPPLLYIKNPVLPGTRWRVGKSTKSVVGQERVKVPAGEFDAVKLVTEGDAGTTTTEWWVKGVGLLKRSQPSSRLEAELMSYSIPGDASVLTTGQTGQKDQTEGRGKAKGEAMAAQTAVAAGETQAVIVLGVDPSTGTRFWTRASQMKMDFSIRPVPRYVPDLSNPCPFATGYLVVGEVPAHIALNDDQIARRLVEKGREYAEHGCPRFRGKPLRVDLHSERYDRNRPPNVVAEWKQDIGGQTITLDYRNRPVEEKRGRRVEGNFVIFGEDKSTGTVFGVVQERTEWIAKEPCIRLSSKRLYGVAPNHINITDDTLAQDLAWKVLQSFQTMCPQVAEQSRMKEVIRIEVYLLRQQYFPKLTQTSASIDASAVFNFTNGQPMLGEIRNHAKQRAESEARRKAEQEQVERVLAQQRAEQARIAKEMADREAARQRRWNEFARKNGVQELVKASDLFRNPFLYQGKTVAVWVAFERMMTANSAIFVHGDRIFVVSNIPTGTYKSERENNDVLAAIVVGMTEVKGMPPFGAPTQVPNLRFVDVYFCDVRDCSDTPAGRR